ncbi:hypothetical protein CDL12_28931 [Handroanthus impetiginosus]|uniref:Uncharacterized protein n=1 Tax=Handroanthus impetiginosus TaxID=429701 RepID=A0A2G9G0A8_9LAMI|nr:hypothetical protein CDL12_28931 [Handroanthus impetiginosus]
MFNFSTVIPEQRLVLDAQDHHHIYNLSQLPMRGSNQTPFSSLRYRDALWGNQSNAIYSTPYNSSWPNRQYNESTSFLQQHSYSRKVLENDPKYHTRFMNQRFWQSTQVATSSTNLKRWAPSSDVNLDLDLSLETTTENKKKIKTTLKDVDQVDGTLCLSLSPPSKEITQIAKMETTLDLTL